MRELTFVGLSDDRLVLSDASGHRYVVAVDDRLATLVRRDRSRAAHPQADAEPMRPRDVQAQIRGGATAEEVAEMSGWPVERVRRFEGPVLAERGWIAEQARAVELRRPEGSMRLEDVVARRLESRGNDRDSLRWDSWRRDDGRWTLLLAYPVPGGEQVATWVYDPAGKTVHPDDAEARDLVDEPPPAVPEPRPRLVGLPSTAAGRQDTMPVTGAGAPGWPGAVGHPAGHAAGGPADRDLIQVVEATQTVTTTVETSVVGVVQEAAEDEPDDVEVIESLARETAPEQPAEPPAPKAVAKSGRGRRASVPSWDEILFGAARTDE